MCMHVVQQQASYHPTALLDHELLSTRVHATAASSQHHTLFIIAGFDSYQFSGIFPELTLDQRDIRPCFHFVYPHTLIVRHSGDSDNGKGPLTLLDDEDNMSPEDGTSGMVIRMGFVFKSRDQLLRTTLHY